MFKDVSSEVIKDLLDLTATAHPADGPGIEIGGPTGNVCLCCYGGCY